MSTTHYPLSVIIASSRPEDLKKCLEGLNHQDITIKFQVIVIGDIAPSLGTQKYNFELILITCTSHHTNVRRNLGIFQSTGDRIAFLDDDTIPSQQWIQEALSLDPYSNCIMTGPEIPTSVHPTSQLIYEASRYRISEGTQAHINFISGPVAWTDAPFCNCVIPRHLFDKLGLLATDIPWDMDDFEFCFRAKKHVLFYNNANLQISHNRYPASIKQWLKYKWNLRVRTGEKLFTHPIIYGRIPGILFCAFLPLSCIVLLLLPLHYFFLILNLLVISYVILLLGHIPLAKRNLLWHQIALFLILVFALHVLTILGIQYGLFRKIIGWNN